MARRKESETLQRRTSNSASEPKVIVDFIFDDGLFFVAVENIGQEPALKVKVRFRETITGLGGSLEISALPLFQNIEFLAPRKQIVTFLDSSSAYFARNEPTRISAKISYRDCDGNEFQSTVRHDLEIYKEISYVLKQAKESSPAVG